jgi:hypothetical protein
LKDVIGLRRYGGEEIAKMAIGTYMMNIKHQTFLTRIQK